MEKEKEGGKVKGGWKSKRRVEKEEEGGKGRGGWKSKICKVVSLEENPP